MFTPGQLTLHYLPLLPGEVAYDLTLAYEIRQDEHRETFVHFDMSGEIAGKHFQESFELPRDLAFNFASNATRIAIKHGLPPSAVHPVRSHRQYDLMFADIRQKLNAHPGEPIRSEYL
ncbi:DUF5064 family protein [Stutzerimonas kirkiae]|uniref:DUF5064 domain-containing protein n=1 Tax=Stutzerimonas kirkiae TaxID=2211392 RepID=A0A4Q9RFK7_9GAMM|nr:DUF5064 family protein [Stutzerimonas kirkiae]TBU99283.1 DUF5064 domain-containing protein [Stutzerimonas kirkiae]TBV06257.1 DUF5064 domain-containing protein [Stutzerimonas kirkiae]TBV08001.1 DUF5064 domain-containing protein [Stutzerimonas kirkiae]TBV15852.1 DUF5064 domain-containing protein [Stutzerimonas kirkiae]